MIARCIGVAHGVNSGRDLLGRDRSKRSPALDMMELLRREAVSDLVIKGEIEK